MLNYFTVRIHLVILVAMLTSYVHLLSQVPLVNVSLGVAHTNDAANVQLSSSILYRWNSGLMSGFRIASVLAVPTHIEKFNNASSEIVRTDGSATITTVTACLGWSTNVDALYLSLLATAGGGNASHRRDQWNFGGDEVMIKAYSAPTWTLGFMLDGRYQITSGLSVVLQAGYDYLHSNLATTNNEQPYDNYRAVFASPIAWMSLGLGYQFESLQKIDSGASHTLFVGASVASIHPFTETPYNEFNPGLVVHYRFSPQHFTWFVEAGAYQYSFSDRALYAAGGFLIPVLTQELRLGLLGGILALNRYDGLLIAPVISPRVTVDLPFASLTMLLIPDGRSSAFGFQLVFPLF